MLLNIYLNRIKTIFENHIFFDLSLFFSQCIYWYSNIVNFFKHVDLLCNILFYKRNLNKHKISIQDLSTSFNFNSIFT